MSFWQNGQWAVTSAGLERVGRTSRDPEPIRPERLAELYLFHEKFGIARWPVEFGDSDWVDPDAFMEAFERALELHLPEGRFRINLKATADYVRKLRQTRATANALSELARRSVEHS